MWMLRFAQHDKKGMRSVHHDKTDRVIPNAVRNPVRCGCFASLSMTKRGMRSVHHDGAPARHQSIISSIHIFFKASIHLFLIVNTT